MFDIIQPPSTHFLPENYKKQPKANTKQPAPRNDKEFDSIQQRKNESDDAYLRRVNRITQESAKEAEFEAKYGVEVIRNKKTGEIKLRKKPRNEIDERLKQNSLDQHQNPAKKGAKPARTGIVLTADEKREIAKHMLKKRKTDKGAAAEADKKEFKHDHISFGEVAHAPPTLTTPRLAKKAETVPRVRKAE